MIEKLKEHENETLNRHLDFFQMVRIEDEKVNTEFIRFEPGKKNIFQGKSPTKKNYSDIYNRSHLLSIIQKRDTN